MLPTIKKGLLLLETPKFYKHFERTNVRWVMIMVRLNQKFLLSTEPVRFSTNHCTHCNLQYLIYTFAALQENKFPCPHPTCPYTKE